VSTIDLTHEPEGNAGPVRAAQPIGEIDVDRHRAVLIRGRERAEPA
jgi:hypothetical protein